MIRSENAGMSSEIKVKIFYPECPRFPHPRSSCAGKATLRRAPFLAGVPDGLLVDIPVLGSVRYDLGRDGDGYSRRSSECFV